MEDSTSLVEKTKSKFYETKNKVNSKLGDHLNRSRSLLSEVNRSLNKQKRDDSTQSQRYFVESFVPFKDNSCNEHYRCNSEAYRCSTRLTSPTFTSKKNGPLGMSETPRHMTQAMWLLNTRNVCCNLSNNNVEEEQEKVPEILLKDPADLLRGEKITKEVKSEDKLTQLLNEKGQENFELNKVQEKHNNSISYDIVSSLDFSKKSVDNKDVYGSDEFINSLLNESYNSLENLSQLFNPKEFKLENLKHEGVNSFKDCNIKGPSINMDEMLTQEFVNNSGIDFKQQYEELNNTLLKLNEQDKLKESELAPKVFTKEEKEKNPEDEPKKVEFKEVQVTTREKTTGLETDLLGSFTIIKDDKFGRKMYRLSDFDKKFKSSSKDTNSVQVQTDYEEEEKEVKSKKYSTNVKVVYHNAHEGKSDLSSRNSSLKKQDLYAQKLVSNLLPRVEMKLEAHPKNQKMCEQRGGEGKGIRFCALNPVEENGRDPLLREDARSQRWNSVRQEYADQIRHKIKLGLDSGLGYSAVCRGGRGKSIKRFYILRSPKLNGDRRDYDNFFSSKNDDTFNGINKYGYDSEEDNLDSKGSNFRQGGRNCKDGGGISVEDCNFSANVDKNFKVDPFNSFDRWWSVNTGELNLLREQLSI